MKKSLTTIWIFVVLIRLSAKANHVENYLTYHADIARAEELITLGSFDQALEIHEEIIANYSFVFLRDYKVATQLAWFLGHEDKALRFLQLGMRSGWKMKSVKKNKFLKGIRKKSEWCAIRKRYDSLKDLHSASIDLNLRAEVRQMSLKDQKNALRSIFRFSSKAQDRFGENKFAPQNELYVRRLIEIIKDKGYPGEKLVGYDPWAQGILSRHNSISREYCKNDTLYAFLKPLLLSAISKGEMSPHNFAVIDDWFTSVESQWQTGSYGYLAKLKARDSIIAKRLRTDIGLRTVETRNRLIDVQDQTRMNFYLPVWPKKNGKINFAE